MGIKSLIDRQATYKEVQDFLGLPVHIDIQKIINYIFEERFVSTNSGSKEVFFDYLKDYDAIFTYFLKEFSINLEKQDIDWWQFTSIMNCAFEEENCITKRMSFRSYKVPFKRSKGDADRVNYYVNKRLKYRIAPSVEALNMKLGGLFNRFKKNGGKKNGRRHSI